MMLLDSGSGRWASLNDRLCLDDARRDYPRLGFLSVTTETEAVS